MTKTELAWAAGFFDGEGSVGRRRGGRLLQMQVTQSYPYGYETLTRFGTAVRGGKVYGPYGPYKGARKQYFCWCVSGLIPSVKVIRQLHPYLSRHKREDIFKALPELVL
jgi:hypothetical protein